MTIIKLKNLKLMLLYILRTKIFQNIWEKVFHISKIGMNYWGGATIGYSGEEFALRYANDKLKNLSRKIVIFDVGANVGQFAQLAITEFTCENEIHSFEPSCQTFLMLNEFIENNFYQDKIFSYNIGVGSTEKNMTLFSSEHGSTIASLYDQQNPLRNFKSYLNETVIINTLDNICRINSIEFIDYLKLDIEGHEFHALLGGKELLQANKIHFIQFEFGEPQIDSRTYFRDIYNLLHQNYNFYRIVSNGIVKINEYKPDLEIFNTANYLAENKFLN
jgi:FkbM family methyltransferase